MEALRKYNLNFCRMHSPARLRLIYKDERPEVLEALIVAVHGEQVPDEPKAEKPKAESRKAKAKPKKED